MSLTEPFTYTFGLARRGPRLAIAWLGARVGVVIECPNESDTSGGAVHARNALTTTEAARTRVLHALDTLYETLKSTTLSSGLSPYNNNGVCGLAPVEIPLDNAGAGGLAHHGVSGISVGAALFAPLCSRAESSIGALAVDQVYYYEMGRNFWEPQFNRAFDWRMDDEAHNWGWWTVGFNNLWAIVLPEIAGNAVDMVYFGRSRAAFRARMQRDIRACVRSRHCFDTAWTKSRMPWRPNETINDLMTGLLLALYDAYGGPKFLNSFFAHLRTAPPVNEGNSGANKFQQCRDNFYRIASCAAQRDIKHCFVQQLGWPLSDEVMQEVDNLYPTDKPCAPLPVGRD